MDRVLTGLRPFIPGDIERLPPLLVAARACPPILPLTEQELLSRWQRWHVDPEHDIAVLPDNNGGLIAYSRASLVTDPTRRISLEIAVHPEHRARGIGSALYSLVVERARTEGVPHVTSPLYLAPGETRPDSVRFMEKRGFFADSSYWQMRLDNLSSQPGPELPRGIDLRQFDTKNVKRDAERWAGLIREAFQESATGPRIEAQITEPGSSPAGYFFAVDSTTRREIGTSRGRIDRVGGQAVGYVGTVGVLPAYRGRGIARALVLHTIRHLSSLGLESAILYVENNNTRARGLYEQMGWRPIYRTVHYWKYLQFSHMEAAS